MTLDVKTIMRRFIIPIPVDILMHMWFTDPVAEIPILARLSCRPSHGKAPSIEIEAESLSHVRFTGGQEIGKIASI